MKKKNSSLKKSQKMVIVLSLLYEIIIGLIASNERYVMQIFIMLSLPCLLYWAGVWIWGSGYISKTIKRHFAGLSKQNTTKRQLLFTIIYELIAAVASVFYTQYFIYIFIALSSPCVLYWIFKWVSNKERYITKQKSLFRFLNFLPLFLLFVVSFMKSYGTMSTSSCLGFAVGYSITVYITFFCIASLVTFFIKDKESSKKTSIILILILSLFSSASDLKQWNDKEGVKRGLLNVVEATKKGTPRKEINEIQNDFARNALNAMVNVLEVEIPKYMTDSGLEGIVTEKNKDLLRTDEGVKQLYIRGKDIIKRINTRDISSDVKVIFTDSINKINDICNAQYSETRCNNLTIGMKESYKNDFNNIVKIFKMKKDLIHAEFSVIECVYKSKGSCDKLIDAFMKKESIFRQKSLQLHEVINQFPKRKISAY